MVATVSLIAIAVIAASIAWAWSRKFLAVGALALGNIVVFGLTALGPARFDQCGGAVGFAPDIHWDLGLCAQNIYDPNALGVLQLFTSMFVHADLPHLVGNMFLLLVFALVFEELIGPRRFIVLYLITGLLAAGSQLAVSWGDPLLLMGASGAVAGIVGGFAGSFPNMVMRLPIPGPIIFFARMRVFTWAVIFALMQVAFVTLSQYTRALGGVAYAAHLGGLAFGLGLGHYWIKRAVEQDSSGVSVRFSLDDLDRFALDSHTKRALAEMRANEDEPEVFQVWADRFWADAKDPTTGQSVRPDKRGRIVREDGTPMEP